MIAKIIENDRQSLRKQFLARRDSLTTQEIITKSKEVKKHLFSFDCFMNARGVLFYVSFGSEVITHDMIRDTLRTDKVVSVPYINKFKNTISISQLLDFDNDLRNGTYNILEPVDEAKRIVSPSSLDVIIIPGLLFDRRGFRLGYGKGFYDVFLAALPERVQKIGLAFEAQVTDLINENNCDIPVDFLITEKKIYNFRKYR